MSPWTDRSYSPNCNCFMTNIHIAVLSDNDSVKSEHSSKSAKIMGNRGYYHHLNHQRIIK